MSSEVASAGGLVGWVMLAYRTVLSKLVQGYVRVCLHSQRLHSAASGSNSEYCGRLHTCCPGCYCNHAVVCSSLPFPCLLGPAPPTDVKAELLGTGHSAHGGTDCGNSFTSDDPLACGLAHLFGGAGAELLRHTAPCRSTLGTPGPGAAMGTPLGAAVLSGPAAGGILRDPRHDPRVAARAPHPGPHIPGLPTLLGMAFGGTGSWSLQAEGHEGPASPEQSSAKRPRLSTDNGTGAGSGAGTGAGAGAGMGAGAGWSLPPVLAPPRRLAGWIPVHVGASAGVTGGRPGSLAVDFGGGGGVGTGSGDSGGGGVDGGSTRSSAPACTGTPTALNSVPGGAPIGSQQPASTLDSRGTSSVVTLATPQPPILR